jgi:hypothetical protein
MFKSPRKLRCCLGTNAADQESTIRDPKYSRIAPHPIKFEIDINPEFVIFMNLVLRPLKEESQFGGWVVPS